MSVTFWSAGQLFLVTANSGGLLKGSEGSRNDHRPPVDERRLVEAAQRDPRRFAELYELHFHRVYGYVSRRVQTREEAEDLTGDVFHQALAAIKSFEWRGTPFAAWLYRIAGNAIADRWKRGARESRDPAPEQVDEKSMKDVEQHAALHQLVDRLPVEQRRVVLMRFVEQRSIREIAQEMRKTEGAVKQLQFRALQNLRSSMEGANA